MPFLQGIFFGRGYSLVMMMTMGGFVVTAILLDGRWLNKLSWLDLIIFFILGCYFILGLLGFGNIRSVMISVCTPYYAFAIFSFYYVTGRIAALKKVAGVIAAAILLTILTTLISMQTNPYIARESGALGISNRTQYLLQNVGGVAFVYTSGLMGVMMLSLFFGKRDRAIKWPAIYLVGAAMCFYLAFTGSSGITLLSVITGLINIPLQNRRGLGKALILTAVVILLILYYDQFVAFLQELSYTIDNKYIAKKIGDVAKSLLNDTASGDVAARTTRYTYNIEVFLDSWAMGIGPIYGGGATPIFDVTVSEHTQLLADLARYGIIGAALSIFVFYGMRARVLRVYSELGVRGSMDAFWVTFVLMYTLQPVFSGAIVASMVFLVFPAAPLIFLKAEKTPHSTYEKSMKGARSSQYSRRPGETSCDRRFEAAFGDAPSRNQRRTSRLIKPEHANGMHRSRFGPGGHASVADDSKFGE